jgi:hypothetical protein
MTMVPIATGSNAYQAQIEALKSMAALVEVEEETFRLLLRSRENPTIVAGRSGFWKFKKSVYLTSYDGFIFLLKSEQDLDFAADAVGAFYVKAKELSLPMM